LHRYNNAFARLTFRRQKVIGRGDARA